MPKCGGMYNAKTARDVSVRYGVRKILRDLPHHLKAAAARSLTTSQPAQPLSSPVPCGARRANTHGVWSSPQQTRVTEERITMRPGEKERESARLVNRRGFACSRKGHACRKQGDWILTTRTRRAPWNLAECVCVVFSALSP